MRMSHRASPRRNALAKMARGQVWECNGIPTQMLILRCTEQA